MYLPDPDDINGIVEIKADLEYCSIIFNRKLLQVVLFVVQVTD